VKGDGRRPGGPERAGHADVTGPGAAAAAWDVLLPGGVTWLPGPGRSATRLRRALRGLPRGANVAAPARPWAPRCAERSGALLSYVAVRSRRRPLLVASRDPAVLRYVADAVFPVPPGAGPLRSLALTAGLRLLRHPAAWTLATAAGAAEVVLVGRSR
jgi:hypothetical protein